MDADAVDDASAPDNDVQAGELEQDSDNVESIEVISSGGDTTMALESAGEVLIRVELDLAWHSEKLLNLEILVMHIAARESDFEAFASEKDASFGDSAKKALEFDLLCGILESELNEEENLLDTIQTEIDSTSSKKSSCSKHFEECFKEMQEKLHDCGKSLKQSLERVSEMRLQSDNFKKTLSSSPRGRTDKDTGSPNEGDGYLSDMNSKIRMQTAEQQRHVLRMFEKSLAREMDLEKKLTELRQSEELLKLNMQQEIFCIEEELETTLERVLEAENAADLFLGKSKELMSRLQMAQFNLNASIRREGELKSKCEDFDEQLKRKDDTLQKSERINAELRGKVTSLEKQLEESKSQVHNLEASVESKQESDFKVQEMENLISCLRQKVSEAEHRAESAEAECKLLKDSNMQLSEDVNLEKTSNISTSNKVTLLEKQLRESETQLQHAVASAEASVEKQTMLYSIIKDMEALINDLKSKVAKAESQTEIAEEKCIILSEANSDLGEELNFVRSRMEYLEASLHQTEETKKATAKDIGVRTKLITDLIMQLALERERLHKQISLLMKEKRVLLKRLQKTSEDDSVKASNGIKGSKKDVTSVEESKGETIDLSVPRHDMEMSKDAPMSKAEMESSDFTVEYDTTRNIDARQFNFKYILGAFCVFLVSALVASLLRHQCDLF